MAIGDGPVNVLPAALHRGGVVPTWRDEFRLVYVPTCISQI